MEKDSKEYIDLVKKTVAKDATNDELQTLLYLAKEYNLDPLKKEIWFIKYSGKASIITSRDGYLKIANENPNFNGIEGDVVYGGDILTKRDNGSILIEYGQEHLAFDKSKLSGAFCNIYRKDRDIAVSVFVNLRDYQGDSQIWKKYTNAMILKVAESMALKRAFSISGLVTAEEMDEEIESVPKNTTKSEKIEKNIEVVGQDIPENINPKEYITAEQEDIFQRLLDCIDGKDIAQGIFKNLKIQSLKEMYKEDFNRAFKWAQDQRKLRENNRNEIARAQNG